MESNNPELSFDIGPGRRVGLKDIKSNNATIIFTEEGKASIWVEEYRIRQALQFLEFARRNS